MRSFAAVLQLMELNAWQRFRDSPLHEEFVRSQQTTQTTHLTPADRLRVQVDDALSREPGACELSDCFRHDFAVRRRAKRVAAAACAGAEQSARAAELATDWR